MMLLLSAVQQSSWCGLPGVLTLTLWAMLPLAILMASAWILGARNDYLKLYQKIRGVTFPLPDGGVIRFPLYFRSDQQRQLSDFVERILHERQPEPELERARQRYTRSWWWILAIPSIWGIAVVVAVVWSAQLKC